MGKFQVGDRVRVTRYWPGEMATVRKLPGSLVLFPDCYQLEGDSHGFGIFEADAFEPAFPDSPTLRDQFAMAALSVVSEYMTVFVAEEYATMAYQLADAMLAARAK